MKVKIHNLLDKIANLLDRMGKTDRILFISPLGEEIFIASFKANEGVESVTEPLTPALRVHL